MMKIYLSKEMRCNFFIFFTVTDDVFVGNKYRQISKIRRAKYQNHQNVSRLVL